MHDIIGSNGRLSAHVLIRTKPKLYDMASCGLDSLDLDLLRVLLAFNC